MGEFHFPLKRKKRKQTSSVSRSLFKVILDLHG